MSEPIVFQNRVEAGQKLAQALEKYREDKPVILGMPRGGVVLAYEIAKELQAPLDVIIARKIGAPGQSEFAIGAIAPRDIIVFNPEVSSYYHADDPEVQIIVAKETRELERRLKLFRGNKPELVLQDKTVIVVDDGLATGQSALAAILSIKKLKPRKIILAVGVCAIDSAALLRREVDELICLSMPEEFYAVGLWYRDFSQTTDEEVIELLNKIKY